MAARLDNTNILDVALVALATANKITLCGSEPTTYTEANTGFMLASATSGAGYTAPLVGAPSAKAPNGRQAATAVVANAAVSGTATGNWAALIDTTGSKLLAVLAMTPQALTSGNTWGAASVTIGIPQS